MEKIIVYAMRHAQKENGVNPSLTKRGTEQIVEAVTQYLSDASICSIFCGNLLRHIESAIYAGDNLGFPKRIITELLTINGIPGIGTIDDCVARAMGHPDGLTVGFRVDNWFGMNPVMMTALRDRFKTFVRSISIESGSILAICSSPLPEAAAIRLDSAWLLDEAGIIKYTVDKETGIITDQEIIFDGFLA